jgi:putative ABC transport system substrate-binding protein
VRRRRAVAIIALFLSPPFAGRRTKVLWAASPDRPTVRLGFVRSTPSSSLFDKRYEPAFWERMRELGWIKGENLLVEDAWAEGQIDRLPSLMSELVARKVDILVTAGTPGAIAAKKATHTIPIVDMVMGDPVGTGVVSSLARPGGNLTGLSMGWSDALAGKWLELLQEAMPKLTSLAVIADPTHAMNRNQAKRVAAIAPARGIRVRILDARGWDALDRAFEQAARIAQAVLVIDDPNLIANEGRVVALAAKHRLPDMHIQRDFVDAGGLMSYAPDYSMMFRRTAEYVDKILKGTQARDLPIEQPTKFELVINLRTARVLGLRIPESLLIRADDIIK